MSVAQEAALSAPSPVVLAAAYQAMAPVVPELAGPHRVEQYIAFGLEQNPTIRAGRNLVRAAANEVPQAAAPPDPMVQTTFVDETMHNIMGQYQITAEQAVPWPAKLQLRAMAAEAEANMARAELAAAELEVIAEIKQAYYALYAAQRAIAITERDRRLLQDFTEIAEVRYRVGAVSQQDVLRAQVELASLENDLIQLRQQFVSAQARLAGLLHISPETDLRAVEELSPEELPRDIERLYALAIATRPELHEQLAEVARNQQQIELARLEYLPDFTAGLMYMDMPDMPDAWNPMLAFNVPIWHKRINASIREAEARTIASARQYDALRDRTQAEVKDLFAQVVAQQQLLELFRGEILPKAEQTLEASAQAYQAGTTDFLQLVDNWRQLLQFQIAYYRLEAQLRQSLASLERTVGVPLPPAMPEPVPAPPPQIPAPELVEPLEGGR